VSFKKPFNFRTKNTSCTTLQIKLLDTVHDLISASKTFRQKRLPKQHDLDITALQIRPLAFPSTIHSTKSLTAFYSCRYSRLNKLLSTALWISSLVDSCLISSLRRTRYSVCNRNLKARHRLDCTIRNFSPGLTLLASRALSNPKLTVEVLTSFILCEPSPFIHLCFHDIQLA